MTTIVRWAILVVALTGPYLAASHALVIPTGNGNSTVKTVYVEGGSVLNITSSAVPATVHSPVKKRILSVDASDPAPVQETPEQIAAVQPVVPNTLVVPNKAATASSTQNATSPTTAKSTPVATLDKPQSVGNQTSTSTTDKTAPAVIVDAAKTVPVAQNTTIKEVVVAEKPVVEKKEDESAVKVNGTSSTTVTAAPTGNSTTTVSTTSSTTTTTSTTTPSTTTSTSTTTTTPKPKKPTITVSLDDDPNIVHVPSVKSIPDRLPASPPQHVPVFPNNLDVQEPIAQLSRENLYEDNGSNQQRLRNSRRDLVIPVISLIFTIPMLLGLATLFVRKFRGYWQTRHYRRMDFLVDGIYNDC